MVTVTRVQQVILIVIAIIFIAVGSVFFNANDPFYTVWGSALMFLAFFAVVLAVYSYVSTRGGKIVW